MTKTFEQFQATKREMTSHEFGKLVQDGMWDDEPALPFLVYDDSFWIWSKGEGVYMLELYGDSWESTDLAKLERELFSFAASEAPEAYEDNESLIEQAERALDLECNNYQNGKPSEEDVRRYAEQIALNHGIFVTFDEEGNATFTDTDTTIALAETHLKDLIAERGGTPANPILIMAICMRRLLEAGVSEKDAERATDRAWSRVHRA